MGGQGQCCEHHAFFVGHVFYVPVLSRATAERAKDCLMELLLSAWSKEWRPQETQTTQKTSSLERFWSFLWLVLSF